MKVGDYVRTKYGDVFILDKIEDNCLIPRYVYIPCIIIKEDVKKASHNIIDLIEVGDYVNGKQVEWVGYDLYKEHNNGTLEGIGEKRVLFNSFTKDSVRQSGIKSIVTKEQFSQMEYKVID